ncbi:hypothetical protein H8790_12645 [Oscillibacter hominis]|uniref:Uncharacterized protein n=1 Tax=Oscillibacter hominis TaxID=2763056 RepID=A0A7G9B3Z0_9FIRM|nr:hypothetical protein [Oscillibacter hominis]QNL44271.1 hypothetical protein H8790_12645 [Oscillibacter hominis]
MIPYKKMYALLMGAVSDALDSIDAGNVPQAKKQLLTAVDGIENLYIETALSLEDAHDE